MTSESNSGARIFLADDHPAVLDGLQTLLEGDGHTVCGTAANNEESLQGVSAGKADIVLVDLSLCGESGLDLIPLMVERGIPVLVYSMHEDATTLHRALNQGALGYVTKREPSAVLLEAIQVVLAGEQFISPRIADKLESGNPDSGLSSQMKDLSKREKQIFDLLAQGESNMDIAETLELSVRTLETHYARIIAKLELEGTKALRKFAVSESRLSF